MISEASGPVPSVDLVIACTKRKTLAAPRLSMGRQTGGSVRQVASVWLQAASTAEGRVATSLYAGPAWQAAMRAWQTVSASTQVRLYVVSAGFGLLSESDSVPVYGATFTSGDDQVAARICGDTPAPEKHRAWWAAINELRGQPMPLANQICGEIALIVLGQDYINAVADDLVELVARRGSNSTWLVSCAQLPRRHEPLLGGARLPLDLRLEALQPGPRNGLNNRALEWLVTDVVPAAGWDRARVEQKASELLDLAEWTTRPVRSRMDDSAISEWIGERASQPGASPSKLLRQFRDAGLACEQGRFRRLALQALAEEGGAQR